MPHLFNFLEKSGLVRLAGPMKFPLLPVLVTQPRGRPALVLLHSCIPCRLCAVGHGPGRGLCAKQAHNEGRTVLPSCKEPGGRRKDQGDAS